MKSASELAATSAVVVMKLLSNQARRLPRSSTVWSAPTPTTSSTIPAQSTPCVRRTLDAGGSRRYVKHRNPATIPSGMFT